MIRDPADTITFTIAVTCDGGEIGMKRRSNVGRKQRHAVLRAEDEMNEVQAERLRHGEVLRRDGAGRWPLVLRVAMGPRPAA